MAKILCTLKHAPEEVQAPTGAVVKFTSRDERGAVSDEISDDDAASLAAVPGYEVLGAKPTLTSTTQQSNDEAAELARLRARGVELGIAHAEQMGAKRLTGEIAAKEKAMAEAAAAAEGGEAPKA